MKAFVVKWWHEIAVVAVSLWVFLGTVGIQSQLLDYADKEVTKHATATILVTVANVLIARLRNSPLTKAVQ